MSSVQVRRDVRSFLAAHEHRLVDWLLPLLPQRFGVLHLSALGFVGSVVAVIGLIASNWSYSWVALVVLGVAANWFGSGLAHYRNGGAIDRFSFMVCHVSDLFAQVLLIVGFGLSPFLSLTSAFIVLLCLLLFSSYTYIRAATQRVRQMAYLGVGATEFRLLMIVWAVLGAGLGLREPLVGRFTNIDLGVISLAAMALVGLAVKVVVDARDIAAEESPDSRGGVVPEAMRLMGRAVVRVAGPRR